MERGSRWRRVDVCVWTQMKPFLLRVKTQFPLRTRYGASGSHTKPSVMLIGLWISVLLLASCRAPTRVNSPSPVMAYYSAPDLYRERPLRVALLPTAHEVGDTFGAEILCNALAGELDSTHVLNIVKLPPQWPIPQPYGPPADRLAFLAAMRDEHHVDAVMFSRLSDFRAYWPPRVGLGIEMVSTTDAKTLLSVNGHWDARQSFVVEQFDEYAGTSSLANAYGSSYLAMQSPEHFCKFVAHQIAATVRHRRPK